MWRLLQVLFDISHDGGDGFGIQAPLAERMIGLHHLVRLHLINDYGHLGVSMDSHPFWPIFGPTGHDQGNMVDLVLLAELGSSSFQLFQIVAEEVNVGSDFLFWVLLNQSVDLLDQTGQIIVERPGEDEDDETAVLSVIAALRTNRVAVFRTATLFAAEIE